MLTKNTQVSKQQQQKVCMHNYEKKQIKSKWLKTRGAK